MKTYVWYSHVANALNLSDFGPHMIAEIEELAAAHPEIAELQDIVRTMHSVLESDHCTYIGEL